MTARTNKTIKLFLFFVNVTVASAFVLVIFIYTKYDVRILAKYVPVKRLNPDSG
jgi:hypothetical protein